MCYEKGVKKCICFVYSSCISKGDTNHCLFSSFSSCYSNNIVLETGDKYSLNEDGSELVIKDVKKVDEGDYNCIAKNKAGEKSEEVSLNVFGKGISLFTYCTYLL